MEHFPSPIFHPYPLESLIWVPMVRPQGEALPPTVGVPPALPPNSEQQPNAEGTFPAHPPHAEHEAAVPPGYVQKP
eukprot:6487313-Amphidinium_carterae.1